MASKKHNRVTFDMAIDKFVERSKGSVRAYAINVLNRLNAEAIIRTPGPGNSVQVNPAPRTPTGFLRGSWFAGFGAAPSGTGAKDPSGNVSVGRVSLVAAQLQIGQTYYLMNNAEYAARVEYGFVGSDALGRKYNQVGRYWVRSVIADAPRLAKEIAEGMRTGSVYRPTGGIRNGSFTTGPGAR